ncbi:MAG: helix-turn-helix transcriptional regulator [Phaeovulum sp.]|uniref:helix-turn-helix transcriptional regulator n=1 Tax=Phaeovulum sp. TaxID=2934796 RepID=UPI00272F4635|nr:helix-turn-helix transcriptional regulator [Phaeovulum sp.]MDP2062390.1 helix-turn-helix transcriptional regulator [Phaeovulum sp.]
MSDSTKSASPAPISSASDFGRMIRARRKTLGLTQEDVAMQSGMSLPTVSAIENGKETARLGLVLQICRDLGLRIMIEI